MMMGMSEEDRKMMFTRTQLKLMHSLDKIRQSVCCYAGPTCDCKYLGEKTEIEEIGRGEQTGCCEIRMMEAILGSMTKEEFTILMQRAGMAV